MASRGGKADAEATVQSAMRNVLVSFRRTFPHRDLKTPTRVPLIQRVNLTRFYDRTFFEDVCTWPWYVDRLIEYLNSNLNDTDDDCPLAEYWDFTATRSGDRLRLLILCDPIMSVNGAGGSRTTLEFLREFDRAAAEMISDTRSAVVVWYGETGYVSELLMRTVERQHGPLPFHVVRFPESGDIYMVQSRDRRRVHHCKY